MDVGDWLRSLGLGQYETLFRQNDIDAEVLPEVTEGDLEKFGVSFGHRKRLLRAIASLSATVPSTGLPAILKVGFGFGVHGLSLAFMRSGGIEKVARDSTRVSSVAAIRI